MTPRTFRRGLLVLAILFIGLAIAGLWLAAR